MFFFKIFLLLFFYFYLFDISIVYCHELNDDEDLKDFEINSSDEFFFDDFFNFNDPINACIKVMVVS